MLSRYVSAVTVQAVVEVKYVLYIIMRTAAIVSKVASAVKFKLVVEEAEAVV